MGCQDLRERLQRSTEKIGRLVEGRYLEPIRRREMVAVEHGGIAGSGPSCIFICSIQAGKIIILSGFSVLYNPI